MNAQPQAVLTARNGTSVPLQSVTAHGTLTGLVYELTVEQRYHNPTERNREAIFTFPLPLRAVLLGFDLEIGERKLSAVAVARQEASERYEKAIDAGNSAALIEHDGNGLYTVSLGNLLAGEAAVIRYRYAELLDAHEGHVRLDVPTVIAPRYGDPADSGLEGPAIPNVDLLAEYLFDLSIDLVGLSDVGAIRSPSHKIKTQAGEGGLTVSLARTGCLDRDFVLELDAAAVSHESLVAADGEGCVMLTSAVLPPDAAEARPLTLTLKLLLDCSGSMGGESIAAAKRAVLAILDRLTPEDRVSLTRFGSSVHHITEGLEPADPATLRPLKTILRQIDADLGGTAMRAALEATLKISAPDTTTRDLILITDGEVYDVERIVSLAAQSGHRLFAIAIGAAPNEALARAVAEQTGGACEFVGAGEDAEAAILRTFKRLRSAPRTLAAVDWPARPEWIAPLPTAVFPGDTLHLFAGFTGQPTGETLVAVADATRQGTILRIGTANRLTASDLLPRLAAARRLIGMPPADAQNLAVRYQLATEQTSFVVVAERADGEKATDLPATIAVPHMLAAGLGGTALPMCDAAFAPHRSASVESAMVCEEIDSFVSPCIDRSASMRRRGPVGPVVPYEDEVRHALILSLHEAFEDRRDMPRTFHELAARYPLPEHVAELLREGCVECGAAEEDVIAAFLSWLARHVDTTELHPDFVAMLHGQVIGRRGFRTLRRFMNERLEP